MINFKKYAALVEAKKAVEEELEQLKAEILMEVSEKTETPYGIFTPAIRTSYEYSDKVSALAEKLKIAKVREEEKGIAKIKSETRYLVFTTPKN